MVFDNFVARRTGDELKLQRDVVQHHVIGWKNSLSMASSHVVKIGTELNSCVN